VSRRSDQHPAQFSDEHPASRRARHSGEYPTLDPTWSQAERPASRRAEHRTQEFPAWSQAERPASRRAEHRTQQGPARSQAERRVPRQDDYPTLDSDWEEDGSADSEWEQDEQPAEHPASSRAWRVVAQQASSQRSTDYGRPAQPEASRHAAPARHRKPSIARSAFRRRSVWVAVAIAVAAAAGLVVGEQAHWPDLANQPAALGRATGHATSHATGYATSHATGYATSHASAPRGPRASGHSVAVTRDRAPAASKSPSIDSGDHDTHGSRTGADGDRQPVRRQAVRRSGLGILAEYGNPLRAIAGLLPERIDMGVDFGGSGKIYAIGKGVVVTAMTGDSGWPGGGWMSYRLTAGPAAGQMVFVAEDITPAVTVGQVVTSDTVIANMFSGSAGIETGWAQSNGASPESQAPEAGAIWGQGPFPTAIGMNFEQLLQALGVPAANNRDQSTFGTLPAGYPTSY
jgi:hypothetical protein